MSNVLHCHVRWIGQHLAVLLHCLPEWRRRIHNTLHCGIVADRKAHVLFGNVARSVHESNLHQSVGRCAVNERYVCVPTDVEIDRRN
jgi:hypothetical protein